MSEVIRVQGTPWCFRGETNLEVCKVKGTQGERCDLCIWGRPVELVVGLGQKDNRGKMEGNVPIIREMR